MLGTMAKKNPRKGEAIQAYLDPALVAGLRAFATDTKRTITAALEMAIEAFLRQEGRLPCPADADETEEDEADEAE